MTSSNTSTPAPAGTCQCPPGAKATVGRVTVTGHQDRCAHAIPRTYTWLDGDQSCTGTLAGYAESFAISHDESLPAGELAETIRDTAQDGGVYTVQAICAWTPPPTRTAAGVFCCPCPASRSRSRYGR